MENVVNTNRRRKKVPVESQHFFKHEKEERRSFFILINLARHAPLNARVNYAFGSFESHRQYH